MKSLLSLLGRYALTLIAVAVAAFVAFIFWKQYAQTPWTRDGRVRADVVQIAPDVSGPVSSVAVRDNQWVNRGDVLYAIDPRWLKLAVLSAQADVEAKRHEMVMRQDAARRRALIKGVISSEDIQQTGSAARVAAANYQGALAALELAQLNLSHATVRAPVAGYVTHLRLRPGDYATAGETKVAVVDAHSFWVVGYFEETKLRHIRIGSAARISLMGFDPLITGHVESIGRGIDDNNDATGGLGLPDVNPTFSWVRLAQRVPVRIQLDKIPEGIELVAGLSASVSIVPESPDGGHSGGSGYPPMMRSDSAAEAAFTSSVTSTGSQATQIAIVQDELPRCRQSALCTTTCRIFIVRYFWPRSGIPAPGLTKRRRCFTGAALSFCSADHAETPHGKSRHNGGEITDRNVRT